MYLRPALMFACCLAIFASSKAFGQKRAYIPAYIRDSATVEGRQFRPERTAQSDNFFLIWGAAVANDPRETAEEDLRFDPRQILDTLEAIYRRCKDLGLVNDAPGTKAATYKFVVVLYNTYGPGGPEGWANGWAVDDTIGAFWVHPLATRTGIVTAHEFTHSLQAQLHIDNINPYRGTKAIFDNIGLFYETHANYVRNVLYPEAVTSDIDAHHYLMLEPDWKFNYEGYHFLFHIHHELGMDWVSRLWSEWRPNEVPLQTLRRITSMSQADFNTFMFRYARRAVCWDYDTLQWGTYLRRSRAERLNAPWGRQFSQRTYDILQNVDGLEDVWTCSPSTAPQDYGYNVVRLYPTSDTISLTFAGHRNVNDHAGWRYGIVTERSDGRPGRYGEIHTAPTSTFQWVRSADDAAIYLVVMGAPQDSMHANSIHTTWNGNPKRFHYPYDVRLNGAVPDGYQPSEDFRPWLRTDPGARHVNGGGWVASSARVDASVFVAPYAMVVGSSVITDSVRILDHAYVANARCSGKVTISGNAFVLDGTYMDSAVVTDHCFAMNNTVGGRAYLAGASMVSNYDLHGTVKIFGDLVVYNDTASCDNGEYHVLTQYYRNEPLPCDGRDSNHPENVSVNRRTTGGVVSVAEREAIIAQLEPNPARQTVAISSETSFLSVVLYSVDGQRVLDATYVPGVMEANIDLRTLQAGIYTVVLTDAHGRNGSRMLVVMR
ncbi:MAG: T9SS type A sorting domain-containing protein [Candidatus Kapabacteria bacterium]|nr:T9SS type A sorting domain-containing protein [Candidatus Kapabacteria bacterium]